MPQYVSLAIFVFFFCLLFSFGCGEEEQQGCTLSHECPELTACVDRDCIQVSCYSNLDCPVDAICHTESQLCGALQCRRNADCDNYPEAPYCVLGLCQATPPPDCRSRAQCEIGETCLDGECVFVPSGSDCTANDDCGVPEICDHTHDQQCVLPCRDNLGCEHYRGHHICNPDSGLCLQVECLSDAHCPQNYVCTPEFECEVELFQCSTLVCEGTDRPFRTPPTPEGLCRCVECLNDNHCSLSNHEICDSSNQCLYCEHTARLWINCPEEHPLHMSGCCFDCWDHRDCEHLGLGSPCLRGQCFACNCAVNCVCPPGSSCNYGNDLISGECVPVEGGSGDPCLAQNDCGAEFACSYATGLCVDKGQGSFCTEQGCPQGSRCAERDEGALCYGCQLDPHCPANFFCLIPGEPWGFEGGLCLPEY